MSDNKHNGWTNYETWAAALWIDNEQSSLERWQDCARQCLADASPEGCTKGEQAWFDLTDMLKTSHEEDAPEVEGVYVDLLNAALSEINWHEIAAHLIDGLE